MSIKRLPLIVAASLFATAVAGAQSAPATATAPRAAAAVAAPAATSFKIDPVHSELSFRIRHLIGRVAGNFTEWDGTLVGNVNDMRSGAVNVTVQTKSIDTQNDQRDAHLLTPDFFAADSFPTITFRSTRVEQVGNLVKVHGDLTMRGQTRPVILDGTYRGLAKDPWGGERVAFHATTTVNRQDFGIAFNQIVEGSAMLGDDVHIEIAIEAVKQQGK